MEWDWLGAMLRVRCARCARCSLPAVLSFAMQVKRMRNEKWVKSPRARLARACRRLRNPPHASSFSTPRICHLCCGTKRYLDTSTLLLSNKSTIMFYYGLYARYTSGHEHKTRRHQPPGQHPLDLDSTQDTLHTVHFLRQEVFSSSRHTPRRPPPWRQFIRYYHRFLHLPSPMSAFTLGPCSCLDLGLGARGDVFPTKKEQFIHEFTLLPLPAPWRMPVGAMCTTAAGIRGPMMVRMM